MPAITQMGHFIYSGRLEGIGRRGHRMIGTGDNNTSDLSLIAGKLTLLLILSIIRSSRKK